MIRLQSCRELKHDQKISVRPANTLAFAGQPVIAALFAGCLPFPQDRLLVCGQESEQFVKELPRFAPGITPFGKIAPFATGKLFRFPNRRETVQPDNFQSGEPRQQPHHAQSGKIRPPVARLVALPREIFLPADLQRFRTHTVPRKA